jgi:hypothetical protein
MRRLTIITGKASDTFAALAVWALIILTISAIIFSFTNQPAESHAIENNMNSILLPNSYSYYSTETEGNDSAVPPVIDGVIGSSEYEFDAPLGGGDFHIYWQFTGENITMAMKARSTGWIALGIDPEQIMKGADMIFGWVDSSGNARILDCYSTGKLGPHPPDIELGGTTDIVEYAGAESGGWTVIEFKRAAATSDKYDKDIEMEGKTKLIWAYGSSDNFDIKHTKRGTASVDFETGSTTEGVPWYFHAAWMTAAVALMIIGIIIVKFLKEKRWWFKGHKAVMSLAVIVTLLGFGSSFFMVTLSGSGHFRVPHAYFGLITIVISILTTRLGFMMFSPKVNKDQIKSIHRWIGRGSATLMFITIFVGLSYVGII